MSSRFPGFSARSFSFIIIKYNDKEIGRVDLVAKSSVDRNPFLYVMALIKSWTRSESFKKVVMALIGIVVIYIAGSILMKLRKKRR